VSLSRYLSISISLYLTLQKQVENDMISMERILNVLEHTPQETYRRDEAQQEEEEENTKKYYDWWKNTDNFLQSSSSSLESAELLADWPRTGTVEFRGVNVRHRPELPYALNNVTYTFKSGQR
jgi:ABC-type bacteriocin/lantibiotic exporter with double-glycine peptidase domain